jgi:hypothetical protein
MRLEDESGAPLRAGRLATQELQLVVDDLTDGDHGVELTAALERKAAYDAAGAQRVRNERLIVEGRVNRFVSCSGRPMIEGGSGGGSVALLLR